MNERIYRLVVGAIFTLIALLHLARLTLHWEVVMNGTVVPLWVSWLGLVVAAVLAVESFRRQ